MKKRIYKLLCVVAAGATQPRWVALATCVIVAAGCTGSIGDESVSGANRPGSGANRPGDAAGKASESAVSNPGGDTVEADVGLSTLRRMGNLEYDNTVAALLGDKSAPSSRFLPDSDDKTGFRGFRALSSIEFERMREAAEAVAARATAPGAIEKFLPCAAGKSPEPSCAIGFIRSFGLRAFRRPLNTDESGALQALYANVRKDPSASFSDAIAVLIEGILQDPRFLYHRIVGSRGASNKVGDRLRLTSFEIAEQLSYLFWRAPPDDLLGAEADADRLTTSAAIEAQARRLAADPRGRGMMSDFHEHWLNLGRLAGETRDPKAFPDFNEAVRKAMREETRRLVEDVIFSGDARLSTLLTTTSSFVNGELAPVYGLTNVAKTRDFGPQPLPSGERAGLLTQASFLTSESSLIHRGKFVRERLFCQEIPAPPASVNAVLVNPDPKLSVREQFAQHSSNPSCRACHSLMDPIGFGFTNYDAIGKFRRTEAGKPVDATGILEGTDVDGPFSGAVELTRALARSQDVRRCLPKHWFRYAFGRPPALEDTSTLREVYAGLMDHSDDVRELVFALVTSDAFLMHKVAPGEEQQGQTK